MGKLMIDHNCLFCVDQMTLNPIDEIDNDQMWRNKYQNVSILIDAVHLFVSFLFVA